MLKGPQGTLYGEGTMGGAIRYITNKPNPAGLDFAVRGSTETMAHSSGFGHRIDGMVNVPLGDLAAVRAILYSRDMKGLIDAPGRGEDTDWEKETGGRITLGYYPTDTFEAHAMYMDVDMTGGGPAIAFHCYEELRVDVNLIEIPSYPNEFDCSGDHNAQFDRDPYITHKAHPTLAGTDLDGTIDEYELFNVDFTWDLPFATLTGNYSQYDRYTKRAGDESPPHVNFSRRFVEDFNCGFSPSFSFLPTGECDVSTAPTINPMTGRGGIMAGQICHSTCISWAGRLFLRVSPGLQHRQSSQVDDRPLLQGQLSIRRDPCTVPGRSSLRGDTEDRSGWTAVRRALQPAVALQSGNNARTPGYDRQGFPQPLPILRFP